MALIILGALLALYGQTSHHPLALAAGLALVFLAATHERSSEEYRQHLDKQRRKKGRK